MKTLHILFFITLWAPVAAMAAVEIDRQDEAFLASVSKELQAMRVGARGVACQALVERLDGSMVMTHIRPVTEDEASWHPNDKKGTRSHIVPQDTKIQGAERKVPTGAVVYVHPSRVDPNLSLYKLGTLVYFLSMAADLNTGQFSADYRLRERRAVFFSNAWKDSLGYSLLTASDNVPTPDYQKAKLDGALIEEQKANFPLLIAAP